MWCQNLMSEMDAVYPLTPIGSPLFLSKKWKKTYLEGPSSCDEKYLLLKNMYPCWNGSPGDHTFVFVRFTLTSTYRSGAVQTASALKSILFVYFENYFMPLNEIFKPWYGWGFYLSVCGHINFSVIDSYPFLTTMEKTQAISISMKIESLILGSQCDFGGPNTIVCSQKVYVYVVIKE